MVEEGRRVELTLGRSDSVAFKFVESRLVNLRHALLDMKVRQKKRLPLQAAFRYCL